MLFNIDKISDILLMQDILLECQSYAEDTLNDSKNVLFAGTTRLRCLEKYKNLIHEDCCFKLNHTNFCLHLCADHAKKKIPENTNFYILQSEGKALDIEKLPDFCTYVHCDAGGKLNKTGNNPTAYRKKSISSSCLIPK